MITEEDLIEALEKLDIPVNQRALTDWRQKHYLPPLTARGRGRGQGKLYFWTDPRVIRQVILVDEIILAGLKGKRINLTLWFLGYEVPLSIVRQVLLEGIEKIERDLTGGRHSGEEIEDHVSWFVSKYYEIAHRYPQLGLPTDSPPGEMQILINILMNPEFDLNEIPYMEGARAFVQRLGGPSDAEGEEAVESLNPAEGEEVSPQWVFVRNIFFIGRLKEALVRASDERMSKVQADVSLIFAEFVKLVGAIPAFGELRQLRFHAARDVGVVLTIIDLALRHGGLDEMLDKHIPKIPEYLAEKRLKQQEDV